MYINPLISKNPFAIKDQNYILIITYAGCRHNREEAYSRIFSGVLSVLYKSNENLNNKK